MMLRLNTNQIIVDGVFAPLNKAFRLLCILNYHCCHLKYFTKKHLNKVYIKCSQKYFGSDVSPMINQPKYMTILPKTTIL